MNPSTPETSAPLSFDSPAIKDALQHYNLLKPLLRASLSNAQIYGLDLADALTHEHEARVRAEAALAKLKEVSPKQEVGRPAFDAYWLGCEYGPPDRVTGSDGWRIWSAACAWYEQELDRQMAAALAGLPAQASAGALGEREDGK